MVTSCTCGTCRSGSRGRPGFGGGTTTAEDLGAATGTAAFGGSTRRGGRRGELARVALDDEEDWAEPGEGAEEGAGMAAV